MGLLILQISSLLTFSTRVKSPLFKICSKSQLPKMQGVVFISLSRKRKKNLKPI
nr:hypothetical protein [uncultured bacterium]